ncbi:MAG: UDP-glucose 4-epimerase GalE [Gammaproteobacteria bacterium]|nr:UDP-glucose 4-epimerase GalE [Gammaproteobacteria bacterium]
MSVLVTGGAGYIGSHTARQLVAAGHQVVVLDNFYSGHRWAVPADATLVEGDVANSELVERLLRDHDIQAVIHFAGYIVVPESVENPQKYYLNNTVGSLSLMQACMETGVDKFIFSSSAAVYGIPEVLPAREDAPTAPINPYGRSKLMTEWMLHDLAVSRQLGSVPSDGQGDFRYVALRYFNVAGASLDGTLGQATPEATHLIKVACEAVCGKRQGVTVFGDDYDTVDGTCVRDYIHVEDLASAHLAALDYLAVDGKSEILNCGYGRGFSVSEVLNQVRQVSGIDLPVTIGPRRAGDPPALVADATRIHEVLDWTPQHQDLAVICRTAYTWERDGMASRAEAEAPSAA